MSKPYSTISPYIITINAYEVIEFIKKAFDAKEIHLQKDDDGLLRHSTFQIEESTIMLAGASEEYPSMPAMLYVYTNDCDAYYKKAIEAGGISLREPTNEHYGERSSGVKDMGGNQWWIAGPPNK